MSTRSNEPDDGDAFPGKALALEREAEMHFAGGNLWQARSRQRQAIQVWKDCDAPEREAQGAHIVGYLCFRLNDHDGAIAAYRRAVELRDRLQDFPSMAISLARLAEVQQHLGNHRKAIKLLETALSHWNAPEYRKERGATLNNLGVSHDALGQMREAKRHYELALTIRREIGDLDGLAASLHNLGALCAEEGNRGDAHRHLNEAAHLRRNMDAKAELGRTMLHLGLLHEQEGDFAQAASFYEEAWQLAVDPEVADPNDEAAALHNLGVVAETMGDHAHALRLLEQAQTILTRTGKKHGLAMSHYHCGLVHRQLKAPKKALEHLLQAMSLQEAIEDRNGLATTLAAAAVIFAEAGVLPPSYDLLVKASTIQRELGQDQAQSHTLSMLGYVCEMQGKQEEALRYQRIVSMETVAKIIQRAKMPAHIK